MPLEDNLESSLASTTQISVQNEGLIKDKYESIFRELQGIISVFYILAVAIGMLFTYQKYTEFGINIFDYADIFEFLVAPFSDVIILVFTICSCILVYLVLKLDTWFMKKYPIFYSKIALGLDKKTWYNSFRYLFSLLILFVILQSSAVYYGQLFAQKTKKQSPISLRFSDNETKEGIIIGNTKQVIFFLEGKKVKVIPFTALVKEFEIKK